MQKIMGILNLTPDSFFDGEERDVEWYVEKGKRLLREGADILDIGGESTRPGAKAVSLEEEMRRVVPVIEELVGLSDVPISIDTRKPKVAAEALSLGAKMINDVTGFVDEEMKEVAKSYNAEVCVMHMQGTPQTMQANPHYPEGIVEHLRVFFEKRLSELANAGISLDKIIVDPGIGFGKTVDDNLSIIKHIDKWRPKNQKVLIGLSRKSFMGKILKKDANALLPATLTMNTMAILSGADLLRVHDVAEHKDLVSMLRELL